MTYYNYTISYNNNIIDWNKIREYVNISKREGKGREGWGMWGIRKSKVASRK